jgi:hypothetical protein
LSNSSKKLTDSLTLEELLHAFQNTNDNETIEIAVQDNNYVSDFLTKFSILPGSQSVPVSLLWNIFNKLNPRVLTRFKFYSELSLHLAIHQNKVQINADAVYLNTQILKIKQKKRRNTLSSEWSRKHFMSFLSTMKIDKGQHKIPVIVFYHIYRCYCIDQKKKQFSFAIFLRFADYFFSKKRGISCNFYLVNEETASIHQQKEFDGIKKIYTTSKKIKKESL